MHDTVNYVLYEVIYCTVKMLLCAIASSPCPVPFLNIVSAPYTVIQNPMHLGLLRPARIVLDSFCVMKPHMRIRMASCKVVWPSCANKVSTSLSTAGPQFKWVNFMKLQYNLRIVIARSYSSVCSWLWFLVDVLISSCDHGVSADSP